MSTLQVFPVNQRSDWQPVASYLLSVAAEAPLDHSASDDYSKDEIELWQRVERGIKAGMLSEIIQFSAVVVYQSSIMISLAMTIEPTHFHLSMVRLRPGTIATERLPDAIAHEIVLNLLGNGDERIEGMLPGVRHFYRMIT